MVDYLLSIGEPLVKKGQSYYMHQDHDSLQINVNKNIFYWNSRGIGGGILQYLMAVHGLTREEAFQKYYKDTQKKNLKIIKRPKKTYIEEFKYTLNEITPFEAKRYLVSKRGLSNSIIQKLIDEHYIAEKKEHKNIIFKWYDDTKVVGYSLQGTEKLTSVEKKQLNWKRDYFKSVAPTTEQYTKWGFNYCIGLPKNLFLFESCIDLLSYWTLKKKTLKDTWLISIEGGDVSRVMNFLIAAGKRLTTYGLTVESIKLGFDRDTAGNKFVKKFNELDLQNKTGKIVKIKDCRPPQLSGEKTDWNDYLKAKKGKL